MKKVHIFTFCVNINRIKPEFLILTLKNLILSLDKTKTNYCLHIFTNFNLNKFINTDKNNDEKEIIIEKYFDNTEKPLYDGALGKWLNMNYNRINIYKYLYDKYKINYLWMDLDTIITKNMNYIADLESLFIDVGGVNDTPGSLIENTKYEIPVNKCIQGNVWKLNIDLYEKMMNTHNEIIKSGMIFNQDLQGLFSYYFYFVLDGKPETLLKKNIYIVGKNYKMDVNNGLSIWTKDGPQQGFIHANEDGLNNLYYDKNNNLCSKYHENKKIEIVSFTFLTLSKLLNTEKYKELFLK